MNRSDFIDFVKGILILLVVIGHATQYVVYHDTNFWLDPLFKAIYMFHMPLFMAVSGYLAHRGIKSSPTGKFIKVKFMAYIIPIFVWSTLFQIVVISLNQDITISNFLIATLREAVGSLWFLWALFVGVSLTAIANSFGRICPFILGILFLVLLAFPDKGNLHLFKYTFPFFLFGFYVAARNIVAPPIRILLHITLISGVFTFVCFGLWDKETYIYVSRMTLSVSNFHNIGLRFFSGAVVSVFALCLFFYAYRTSHHRLREILVTAGKDSLQIYILSGYAFILLLQVSKQHFYPAQNVGLAGALAVFFGFCVAFVCWYLGGFLASNRLAAALLFGKRKNSVRSKVQSKYKDGKRC